MNKKISTALSVIGGLFCGAALTFLIQFFVYGTPDNIEPPPVKYGNFDHLLDAVSAKEPVVIVVNNECDKCDAAIAWFRAEQIAVKVMSPGEFDAMANGRTGQVSPLRAQLFPIVFASDRVVSGFRIADYVPLKRHASL